MTPSQLSVQLRHIAAKISNSKSPRRDLVARDLKNLISKLAADDSNIKPPETPEKPDKIEGFIQTYYLDAKRVLQISFKTGMRYWNDPNHNCWFGINPKGDLFWYNENRKLHREDGPAIIRVDGTEEWYKDGERHRGGENMLAGAAIEGSPSGEEEYWLNGKKIDSADEYYELVGLDIHERD